MFIDNKLDNPKIRIINKIYNVLITLPCIGPFHIFFTQILMKNESFFPTSNEISNGVRFLKKYKMVAALVTVAATAITMISYLQPEEKSDLKHILSWSVDRLQEDTDSNEEESPIQKYKKSPTSVCLCSQVRPPTTIVRSTSMTPLRQRAIVDKKRNLAPQDISPEWGWYVSITPPTEISS